MAGRAAIIIKSLFCHPLVTLSRAWKPVGRPLNPSGRLAASSIFLIASLTTESICTTSRLSVFLEISKSMPSASCIKSYTSFDSSNAFDWMVLLSEMSCRARYFCTTMRA